MSAPTFEHLLRVLERSERPLLVVPNASDLDVLAAAIAMGRVLKTWGKQVEILIPGGKLPEALAFLPTTDLLFRADMPNLRTLGITLPVEHTKVEELTYAVENGELKINIIPKHGFWSPEQVRVSVSGYRFDLAVVIGAQNLSDLGGMANQFADFFFSTPLVSIDNQPSHSGFAAYNVVDVGAISNTEVVYNFLRTTAPDLLTKELATVLLTGMVAATRGFRSGNVTPRTLQASSELVAKGAERDVIMDKLFRTKSMETLRLWGRALTRLQARKELSLAWTSLTHTDFVSASASEDALTDIVDELITMSPDVRVVAIFFERTDGSINVRLHAQHPHDALALGAPFRAIGTKEVAMLQPVERDIVAVEHAIVEHLTRELKK